MLLDLRHGDVHVVGAGQVARGAHERVVVEDVDDAAHGHQHVVLGDLDVGDLERDAVEVGKRDLGTDVDLGREFQRLVVTELGDLDLGAAQRLDVVLADRRSVPDPDARARMAESLGAELVVAEVAVDDGRPVHDPVRLAAAYDDVLTRGRIDAWR